MNAVEILIEDLVMDNDLQTRGKMNWAVVSEYAGAMREGEKFPPVKVFECPESGALFLVDGWHRVEAAKENSWLRVNADLETGTRAAALRYALRANAVHGMRRTREDVARSVKLAFENREALGLGEMPSARLVASVVGVAPGTAAAQLSKLDSWRDAESRTGADGKARAVKPAVVPPLEDFGFSWNENGVCVKPMEIAMPIPERMRVKAVVMVARRPGTGRWAFGFKVDGPGFGSSSPVTKDAGGDFEKLDACMIEAQDAVLLVLRGCGPRQVPVADLVESLEVLLDPVKGHWFYGMEKRAHGAAGGPALVAGESGEDGEDGEDGEEEEEDAADSLALGDAGEEDENAGPVVNAIPPLMADYCRIHNSYVDLPNNNPFATADKPKYARQIVEVVNAAHAAVLAWADQGATYESMTELERCLVALQGGGL